MTEIQVENFSQRMLDLLLIEREAEVEATTALISNYSFKELEKRNFAITKLFIRNVSSGVYGRVLVHFNRQKSDNSQKQALKTTFGPGDIVGVFQAGAGQENHSAQGVVYKVGEDEIVIAFNEMQHYEEMKQPIALVILANEVTYKRCKMAIDQLRTNFNSWGNSRLVDVLFEQQAPQVNSNLSYDGIQYINQGLNESQKVAIKKCLMSQDVSMIHGPPGTGKTTTVVEYILQTVGLQKSKVLACAPSNIAVDNIVERLHVERPGLKIVRIGHPARLLASVQKFCLDALLNGDNDYGKQTQAVRKEIQKLNLQLAKAKSKPEKLGIFKEFKLLRKDLKQTEQQYINMIFQQADVVCCTLTSAADKTLRGFIHNKLQDQLFDVCVIDECAQSIEPACWIAVQFAKRIVLAGDHKQLDATVISDKASKSGLSLSLFERVMNFPNPDVFSTLLIEQYRMNTQIMQWSSDNMYESKLVASETVANHTVADISQCDLPPLILVDTAGSLMHESVEQSDKNISESKSNVGEADVVVQVIQELQQYGITQDHIGVITPYSAQVSEIKKQLKQLDFKIEVSTVDGFQGREKEVIIISMVRSNPNGEIGFLSNEKRMNVAVTRAKRLCVLIGDSGTVCKNEFLKKLIQHFKENGEVRSAFDYSDVRLGYGKSFQIKKIDPQTKELRDEKRKKELYDRITKFQNSEQLELSFSKNLNAYERQLVHERGEQLGLDHKSYGEGKQRFIVVSKKVQQQTLFVVQEEKNQPEKIQIEIEEPYIKIPEIKQQVEEIIQEVKPVQSIPQSLLQHQSNMKVNRANREVTVEFVEQLKADLPEFNQFASSGMASRVSDQMAVYNMYMNVLERSGKIKIDKMEETKQTGSVKEKQKNPKQKPREEKKEKKEKPKIKQLVDVDDDLAFLDQVIAVNQICQMIDCGVQVAQSNYHSCRGCQKVFCSRHVGLIQHGCDESNPFQSQVSKEQSNTQKLRAQALIQKMKENRTAKVPKKK